LIDEYMGGHQILSEDEESVGRVRERLREAVGSHGRMLVSVIPSLQLLIGEQPAMDVEIGASAVQELYSRLFSHLVDVFSRYVTFPLF
jgi:predicted ATPase